MTSRQSRESLMRHLKVLVAELLKRNKQSFLAPLLFVDLLVESTRRSLNMMRQESLETRNSCAKKKSGSCGCVQRNSLVGRSFCDDVT
jgi:hypothetical protein